MTKKMYCPICECHHRGEQCQLSGTPEQLMEIAKLTTTVNERVYAEALFSDDYMSSQERIWFNRHVAETEELCNALRIVKRNLIA